MMSNVCKPRLQNFKTRWSIYLLLAISTLACWEASASIPNRRNVVKNNFFRHRVTHTTGLRVSTERLAGPNVCGANCCKGWMFSTRGYCTMPLCVPRCQNGGVCIQPHKCKCPFIYRGETCVTKKYRTLGRVFRERRLRNQNTVQIHAQQKILPAPRIGISATSRLVTSQKLCRHTVCLNRGKCSYGNCRCTSRYTGTHCEQRKVSQKMSLSSLQSSMRRCQSVCVHGRCQKLHGNPIRCTCYSGYYGRFCTIKSFSARSSATSHRFSSPLQKKYLGSTKTKGLLSESPNISLGKCYRRYRRNTCSVAYSVALTLDACCRGLGQAWGQRCTPCSTLRTKIRKTSRPVAVVCMNGYALINGKCQDINECNGSFRRCNHGKCVNVRGSYWCSCNSGYYLDAARTTCLRKRFHQRSYQKCCIDLNERGTCLKSIKIRGGKSSCCCSIGVAWGKNCELCPLPATEERRQLCQFGSGYSQVPSSPKNATKIMKRMQVHMVNLDKNLTKPIETVLPDVDISSTQVNTIELEPLQSDDSNAHPFITPKNRLLDNVLPYPITEAADLLISHHEQNTSNFPNSNRKTDSFTNYVAITTQIPAFAHSRLDKFDIENSTVHSLANVASDAMDLSSKISLTTSTANSIFTEQPTPAAMALTQSTSTSTNAVTFINEIASSSNSLASLANLTRIRPAEEFSATLSTATEISSAKNNATLSLSQQPKKSEEGVVKLPTAILSPTNNYITITLLKHELTTARLNTTAAEKNGEDFQTSDRNQLPENVDILNNQRNDMIDVICHSSSCFNNGLCVPSSTVRSGFSCICRAGFRGILCEEDLDECANPSNCKGGSCVNTVGSFFCTCSAGYVASFNKTSCEERKESCFAGHQTCTNVLATNLTKRECCCTMGLYWDQCNTCPYIGSASYRLLCPHGRGLISAPNSMNIVDIDECSLFGNESICPDGRCFNSHGTFECVCNRGFYYNRQFRGCKDFNECLLHKCIGGKCVNTIGSFRCECPRGKVLRFGVVCLPAGHLQQPRPSLDTSTTTSNMTTSTTIMSGVRSTLSAQDYDDSSILSQSNFSRTISGPCFAQIVGSSACSFWFSKNTTFKECCCAAGKAWGKQCSKCPIGGSSQYNGLCSDTASHGQITPTRRRQCGVGGACKYGTCMKLQNGWTCLCKKGFRFNAVSRACDDLNECLEHKRVHRPCAKGVCVNTRGSFHCRCNRGYKQSSTNSKFCIRDYTTNIDYLNDSSN